MIMPLISAFAIVMSAATLAAQPAPTAAGPARGDLAVLKGATIAVDPGHNGGNASATSYINHKVPAGGFMKECDTTGAETDDGALTEAAFNWDVARRLRNLLRASGAKVVMTRKGNSGVGPASTSGPRSAITPARTSRSRSTPTAVRRREADSTSSAPD